MAILNKKKIDNITTKIREEVNNILQSDDDGKGAQDVRVMVSNFGAGSIQFKIGSSFGGYLVKCFERKGYPLSIVEIDRFDEEGEEQTELTEPFLLLVSFTIPENKIKTI